MVNLYQLQVIRVVTQLESITRAAELLNLTQPAVSRHIREVEEELGCRLFERDGRRLKGTAASQAMHDYAQRVLDDLVMLKVSLSEITRTALNRLTLATTTTVGNYVLPNLLTAFSAQHPQANLAVRILPRSRALDAVVTGVADLGFIYTSLPTEYPGLVLEVVAQEEMVVVCQPGNPLARRDKVSGEELAAQRMLLPLLGSPHREIVDANLHKLGVHQPTVAAELGSTEAIKNAARVGLGVAVLSRYTVYREVQQRSLCVLPVSGMPLFHTLDLVYRPECRMPPILTEFAQFVRAQGNQMQGGRLP